MTSGPSRPSDIPSTGNGELAAAISRRFSVAMSQSVHDQLCGHLLRDAGHSEELCFALWTQSSGSTRDTALLWRVLLPEAGDREVHGNVSFMPCYVERALREAAAAGTEVGIALLHSHLGPGWQDMSGDDVVAEQRLAGPAHSFTGLPLVGLTLGTDGAWSARLWRPSGGRQFNRTWAEAVRVSGRRLKVTFDDRQVPRPVYREQFRRTQTVWGADAHTSLARLRVGIIGLGSVGSAVAEQLARAGVERVTLIDFDRVEPHNLDRLQGADNGRDVGRLKVELAEQLVRRSSTAASVDVCSIPLSIVEPKGYAAALDCDVLFSCVDRPRARQALNHLAYAHLIPVVDGGIAVRFRNRRAPAVDTEDGVPTFAGAEWQAQTVGPERACLECLGMFRGDDADLERSGMLDDPAYMEGLPRDHRLKANENVYAFSTHLAALEMFQFIGLTGGLPQVDWFGKQRHYFVVGETCADPSVLCRDGCTIDLLIATGDREICYTGKDLTADRGRRAEPEYSEWDRQRRG